MDCNTPIIEIQPYPILTLDDSNFQNALDKGVNLMVDFYAPWCKACIIFEPKFKKAVGEALEKGFNVTFAKADVSNNPIMKKRLGIHTYPRLLFFPSNGARPSRYRTTSFSTTSYYFAKGTFVERTTVSVICFDTNFRPT